VDIFTATTPRSLPEGDEKMPTSINHPPDARGKYSLPLLFALTGIAVLSFLVYVPPSKGELLDKLTSRLREEKFEQLYEEADDHVRLNVTRERFVRRMRAAVGKLKAIDPGLHFQQDAAVEHMFASYGLDLITTARRLEGNGKSVMVLLHWNPEGEFSNINVTPSRGTPDEFSVDGVTHRFDAADGQALED
jgi:hypothetical protein